MLVLILGLIVFLGTHAISIDRERRAALIARLGGEGAYKGVYSLASFIGLGLIFYGYGLYRESGYIQVWTPPVWTAHLSLLLMVFAFIALAAAYLPGQIKRRLKHPMLVAAKIWALAHLLANGDLGSIILFGSLLAYAVIDRIAVKRRPIQHEAQTHGGWGMDAAAVTVGLAAYVAFALWLHPLLIGVSVIPGR